MTREPREYLDALGRRAVACPRWAWIDGMRYNLYHIGRLAYYRLEAGDKRPPPELRYLPDLGDPATLGCLLALVRHAWGSGTAGVMPGSAQDGWRWSWYVCAGDSGRRSSDYASEAEALVAMLEAAP